MGGEIIPSREEGKRVKTNALVIYISFFIYPVPLLVSVFSKYLSC